MIAIKTNIPNNIAEILPTVSISKKLEIKNTEKGIQEII